jgi:hypothetical protein
MSSICASGGWRPLVLAGLLLLTACAGEPESPESRVRAVLDAMQLAVEERSLQDVAALLHPAYSDQRHAGKREAMASLLAYLRRHRQFHLFTLVDELHVGSDGRSARVAVFVAMGGVPFESLDSVLSLRADLYRFDIDLLLEDGDWLLYKGAWQRVRAEDILR